MKIAIFGLGYVGLTAAACLSKEGHDVVGIDVSCDKVVRVNRGESPICEPGLDSLISSAVADGKLVAYQKVTDQLEDCDIVIVCVGTPSAPDGAHNMTYIAEVTRHIANAINPKRAEPLTVVYRSTVRPGTIEELVQPIFASILGERHGAVELVYNPEFLRESVAIQDYFSPPKVVIGTIDGRPSRNMDRLNACISAPMFYTGFREAELTKFVDNSFHALKVAFANEIGRICIQLGISATKVHEIFIADTKLNISPYYLRPGGAFGGSCLPKDVRALQHISNDVGAGTHVIDSLIRSNETHKQYLFSYSTKELEKGAKVLIIGLAFKADSDDLRESPNLDLARRLLQAGFKVSVFDDSLNPMKLIGQNLEYSMSHLPFVGSLLISQEEAEINMFDRVIDTNGRSTTLNLTSNSIVHIDRL